VRPSARALVALPLLLVAVFYGWVSRQWVFAGVVSLALLTSIVVGARLALQPTIQRTIALVLAGAAIALSITSELPLHDDVRALKRPWGAATLAALAIAAFRLFLRQPERGPIATFLVGLIAAMTAGETLSHRTYGPLILAYLAAALLGLRAQDPGRPPLRALSRREWGRLGALLGLMALIGGTAVKVLPPLSDWSTTRILMALGDESRTGFGDRMWLGAMEGMLQSDEVVMRLDGPETDYLRGAVYDHYERSRWSTAKPEKAVPWPSGAPLPDRARAVQATLVAGARDRYFLPLGASRVAMLEGVTTVDAFGVLHTLPEAALGVWFDPEGKGAVAVAAPSDEDLQIPPSIQAALQRLSQEWIGAASTPRARVEAIADHLRSEYRYSLHFESHRRDPVLNFLLEVKQGHCEYFASGLALLARSAGVPARVVIGYRVSEKNPLGGYHVVRERNAHAWVEAFLPGEGWTTFDATPAADLALRAPLKGGWLRSLGDLTAFLWTKGRVAWAQVSLLQVVVALAVVIALGLLLRWWRRRGLVEQGSRRAFADHEPPPPGVLRLFAILEQRGLRRDGAEPLERFARRLEGAELGEAAALLLRYAAHRYGGVGDGAGLLADIDRCAAGLRRA
jgi:transglutaminase-like putative cysteine protease